MSYPVLLLSSFVFNKCCSSRFHLKMQNYPKRLNKWLPSCKWGGFQLFGKWMNLVLTIFMMYYFMNQDSWKGFNAEGLKLWFALGKQDYCFFWQLFISGQLCISLWRKVWTSTASICREYASIRVSTVCPSITMSHLYHCFQSGSSSSFLSLYLVVQIKLRIGMRSYWTQSDRFFLVYGRGKMKHMVVLKTAIILLQCRKWWYF